MLAQYPFNQLRFFLSALLVLSLSQAAMAFQDCEYASDLLYQAFDLHSQGISIAKQRRLLKKALRYCSKHAEVHHALASLYEEQRKWQKAIYHHQQAVKQEPNFYEAWYGLGEIYYKQKRLPLSLEAHLHACSMDEDSKARVKALLKGNRYAVIEKGEIIDKENLLVLYNTTRRKEINRRLSACGLRARVEPRCLFRNFRFYSGKATLKRGAKRQLKELAAALRKIEPAVIKIHAHTDIQSFKNVSLEQSDKLNFELSQKRADTVATKLARQGVPMTSMETHGHGYHKPLTYGTTPTALAKNRRVEIEVEEWPSL